MDLEKQDSCTLILFTQPSCHLASAIKKLTCESIYLLRFEHHKFHKKEVSLRVVALLFQRFQSLEIAISQVIGFFF